MNKEKKTKKKKVVPITKRLQVKCDNLLTPIIKNMYPTCLFFKATGNEGCFKNTQVAHHHVHKSKASALRYEINNLIPLCNHCHLMLHHNESYWASKIVVIRGIEWFIDLEEKNNIAKSLDIKMNKAYYEDHLESLSKVLLAF